MKPQAESDFDRLGERETERVLGLYDFSNTENTDRIGEFDRNRINCTTQNIIDVAKMLIQFKKEIRVFPAILSIFKIHTVMLKRSSDPLSHCVQAAYRGCTAIKNSAMYYSIKSTDIH